GGTELVSADFSLGQKRRFKIPNLYNICKADQKGIIKFLQHFKGSFSSQLERWELTGMLMLQPLVRSIDGKKLPPPLVSSSL
ncbi:hypothetical protein JRQ81_012302, partial [Phrynocephalus forsythii]